MEPIGGQESEKSMSSRDQIARTVIASLADRLEVDVDRIQPSDRLEADWSLDGFDLVLIGVGLEEALDVELPTSALGNMVTVGELIGLVRACASISPAETPTQQRAHGSRRRLRVERAGAASRTRRSLRP